MRSIWNIRHEIYNLCSCGVSVSPKSFFTAGLTAPENTFPEVIQEILVDSGISEEESMRIEKSFTKNFADTELLADTVLDKGAVIINAQKKREEKLEKKVEDLQTKLEETKKEFKLAREIVTTPEVIEEAVTEEILSDETEQEVASDNDTVEPSTEYDSNQVNSNFLR